MFYYIVLYKKFNLSNNILVPGVECRILGAFLTAFLLSLVLGRLFIKNAAWFRCAARISTPINHRLKGTIPTMGGLFIVSAVIIAVLFWCNPADVKIWLFFLAFLGFGAIGCWDDVAKIKHHRGISAAYKFFLQLMVAGLVAGALLVVQAIKPTIELSIPFLPHVCWYSCPVFLVWVSFVLIGCSNAVNLTDGLDGLAASSLVPNFALFALIAYAADDPALAEMAVVAVALLGGIMGFWWYNAHPAQVFMGDVGSLALGGALAYLALVCKQEFILVLSGGLFVIETVSVMMQICSWRIRGKKLFLMAPIHHHFELLGWPESRITARFSIISYVLSAIALIMLKLL